MVVIVSTQQANNLTKTFTHFKGSGNVCDQISSGQKNSGTEPEISTWICKRVERSQYKSLGKVLTETGVSDCSIFINHFHS